MGTSCRYAYASDVQVALTPIVGSDSVPMHQAAYAAVARAASTFADALKAIRFPAEAKADADSLLDAVVVMQGRAASISKMTDVEQLVAAETAAIPAVQAVTDKAAILRDALGLQAPS